MNGDIHQEYQGVVKSRVRNKAENTQVRIRWLVDVYRCLEDCVVNVEHVGPWGPTVMFVG
jgi:hypothetical protein